MSPIVLKGSSIAKVAGKGPASGSAGAAPAGPADQGDKPVCDKSPPPIDPGDCDYYQKRHDSFLKRHRACPHAAPDYYLAYGKRYCVRFSTELYPKLSEKGKAWLLRAKAKLQEAIEGGLKLHPELELVGGQFREFAFGTHADAYWDAGLHDLPFSDKVKIALTPDAKEWLSGDTWSQAADVGARDAKATAGDAWDATKDGVDRAGKWVAERASNVAEDVRQYFRDLFR